MQTKTTWHPAPGWLLLKPTKLPEKTEGGILLPESYTVKNTSGVCVKVGHDTDTEYLGQELFFPKHEEYQIIDSDTGELLHAVPSQKIILSREPQPQPEFLSVGEQGTSAIKPFERVM